MGLGLGYEGWGWELGYDKVSAGLEIVGYLKAEAMGFG